MNAPLKRCCHCQQDKSLAEFNKDRSQKDGYSRCCRICRLEVQCASRKRNPESTRESQRRYVQNNPDRIKQSSHNYYLRNKAKYREYVQNYIAKRYGKKKRLPRGTIPTQYKRQKGRCYWCGKDLNGTYHIDHIIPLSRGGEHIPDNIVIACPGCNLRKWNRLPHEWEGSGGRLL